MANDSFECDGNNLNTIEKNVSGWSTSTIQSPNGLTVGETSTFDLGLRNRSGYLAFCNPQPQTERARSFPTRGRQHHRERLNNDRHDPGTALPHRIHVQQRRDTPVYRSIAEPITSLAVLPGRYGNELIVTFGNTTVLDTGNFNQQPDWYTYRGDVHGLCIRYIVTLDQG